MREVAGVSANYYLVPVEDGKFNGFAEFALSLSEPEYVHTPGSKSLYSQREIETVRFGAGVKAIDELIDTLIDARKGLRELEGSDG